MVALFPAAADRLAEPGGRRLSKKPPSVWVLHDGKPDLVIGCGRNTARPALAIRRASGGRTLAAQVQDPRVGRGEFDMLFVPEHDRLRGPQIVVTRGAIHRVTSELLAAER